MSNQYNRFLDDDYGYKGKARDRQVNLAFSGKGYKARRDNDHKVTARNAARKARTVRTIEGE